VKYCPEKAWWVSSGAKAVVKYTPLLLPQVWRADMSHKPEKLRSHPSSKGMVLLERVEIYVDISVALLAVESKWHFKSSAYPSSLPLHSQIAEDIDLSMVLNRHQLGICSVLLRSVPLQSKPIA
jgi:hypothetical protein